MQGSLAQFATLIIHVNLELGLEETALAVLAHGCKADIEAGVRVRLISYSDLAFNENQIFDAKVIISFLIIVVHLQTGCFPVECQLMKLGVLSKHFVDFFL